jgi:hypothetical protein
MANHARLFFIQADAMINHQVDTAEGTVLPLLEWIERQLAQQEDLAEREVAEYLFAEMPGIIHVTDFRHEWVFDECLQVLLRDAAPAMRARLGYDNGLAIDEHDSYEVAADAAIEADRQRRTQFLSDWDSPLKVLNMMGWQFFLPEDIAYCVAAYQQHAAQEEMLQSRDREWSDVIEAHRNHTYNAAFVLYESFAFY